MDRSPTNRIGIMGGTFDPIHFGHLFIAECARHRFNLEKVLFIPSGRPVHKHRTNIVEPLHRLEMTKLAIDGNPSFEISSLEINRPGPTYTVDTLAELQAIDGGSNSYFFITGADAIQEILTWKDVNRVMELCSFIAVTRPGYSLEGMNKIINSLSPGQRAKICVYETGGILVSSTEIRERIKNEEPFKYLVPEKVEQYITHNQLYR